MDILFFFYNILDFCLRDLPNTKFIKHFTFIHIGKCGGMTVRKEFDKKGFNFDVLHTCKVKYNKNKNYVIVVRNPIKRFISAFNWRYSLLKNKIQVNDEELCGYEQYGSVNNLCESLCDDQKLDKPYKPELNKDADNFINRIYGSQDRPNHIGTNINFYIGNFLDSYQKSLIDNDSKNIIAVIVMETMEDDMKHYFDIDVSYHENRNSDSDNYLSELGYKNLRRYLEKDYECIKKMFELNLITKIKFELLSK